MKVVLTQHAMQRLLQRGLVDSTVGPELMLIIEELAKSGPWNAQVHRIGVTDSDAPDLAIREFHTPLYEYRAGNYRIAFTTTTDEGDSPTLIILTVDRRPELR